uniref:Uncharacterized protein n=1 Tax=Panagrolaimus sp. PS1159 TaxID=55785 RepID=A0AC35FZV0_9BILA
MAAIENNDEEEVALVEEERNNDFTDGIKVEEEEVEGLDRSTEATNDEFINFIVPDCLSQHENSKICFFDNNNNGGGSRSKDSEEEDFFTPILPPEIEAAPKEGTKMSKLDFYS